jgi:hypothetical protein
MMPETLLDHYGLQTYEQYATIFGDTAAAKICYYETFLVRTDYIANKIIEAQVTGAQIRDYTEELQYRQYCRDQINLLTDGGT